MLFDSAFREELLASLNSAQRDSVTAADGPVLVVAGAGTGKTRVLTTRIAWLLAEGGARPSEIVAFTFTNKAAREMRERVDGLVGAGAAPFWIGTFHATGVRILRADGAAVGVPRDFTIYDSDDSLRLIKQVQKNLGIDPKQFPPQAARAAISRWKNDDVDPATATARADIFVDQRHAEIYARYGEALRRADALDFDDLILRTVHLLEGDAAVREKYAARFRHVLVDEFQDTNPLQLILVKALASVHGNVFVVGDDDQAIYSWRGACVENMLNFEDYFPGTRLFRLEQNYRSTGNVLAAANAVIAHNKRRKGKNLWTAGDDGDPLGVEQYQDAEDEAARVVEIVGEETAAGRPRGAVTVLYRTNAQSRLLEDALRRAGVPHQVVGSLQFYERREVRDLLAYLKLVANPRDLVALQRVINVPRRRIGSTTVDRLLGVAAREELSVGEAAARSGLLEGVLGAAACKRVRAFLATVVEWREAAGELPVSGLLERIIADVGYARFLQDDDAITAHGRAENVAELVNATHAFAEAAPEATLAGFLEQVALVSDPDTIADGEGAVRLMTIHTAKGLEFPVVVVTGCEDELLPHAASNLDEAGLEEERRLFYVAVTRTRERAYLLHAARRRRFGAYEDTLPSRFLAEIPAELVESRSAVLQPQRPVAETLFGSDGRAAGWRPVGPPRVAPGDWNRPPRRSKPAAGWSDDVAQDNPFYAGQSVSHATFGAGIVVRVEGRGDDLSVTVDFREHGRKHILPRFAPLVPLD